MKAVEVNLDGLVGPTHNYAGLSYGNIASTKNAQMISNPREAALQGLRKMKFVHDLGIPQLIMPPQKRPALSILNRLGYKGIADADASLLHQLYSSSSMWTANAATVSPSTDTADSKVHFTPANLASNFHRFIEAYQTAHYLKQIFPGECFVHHAPLPAHPVYADEGAANHMRLCNEYGEKSTELFVYGGASRTYPARQTQQSVHAIARLHGLDPRHTFFLEQSAEAIDAGVFHNDVIAMSNGKLFIYHEKAYTTLDTKAIGFTPVYITERELPLADAVATYFFNSQLLTLPGGETVVIAPSECEEHPKARACFEQLIKNGCIKKVHYLNLRESMRNGGGPACLRLRVVLTEAEQKTVLPSAWLNDFRYDALCRWIAKHYRDRISPDDLRDPSLEEESFNALNELSTLLQIQTGSGMTSANNITSFHLPYNQSPSFWIAVFPRNLSTELTHDMKTLHLQLEQGMYYRAISKPWVDTWRSIRAILERHNTLDHYQVSLLPSETPPSPQEYQLAKVPVSALDALADSLWLGDAMLQDKVVSYMQPVLDKRGKVFGYEAFARVETDGEPIGGGKIIEASRGLNAQYALDRHLHVKAITSFITSDLEGFLFINFVPGFIHRPEKYLEGLTDAVKFQGMPSKQIVLDFTRSESPSDLTQMKSIFDYCRSKGYSLSLDDISSTSLAKKILDAISPDFIKLDIGLVRSALAAPEQKTIAELVKLAHSSGVTVAAEGVESKEIHDELLKAGVDLFQGYLFSPPVAVSSLKKAVG